MIDIHPGFVLLAGAALTLFLPKTVQKGAMVASALAALGVTVMLSPGDHWVVPFASGLDLTLLAVDGLSLLVAYVFTVIGLLAAVYAVPAGSRTFPAAALAYMGSSLGVVFAGDLFTLFIFWEAMAITSLALIWDAKTREAGAAGLRYILIHVFGGVCLFAGIVILYAATGSAAIVPLDSGIGSLLLLIGIGVNAAFIPLHAWVPDAYPRASLWGSVFLAVFTTKAAVYVLARTGVGLEAVAVMGGLMAVYGAFYALLQNDIRRLLSYSIISQIGYMVAAIGIGTSFAVAAGIAHLVNDILFKALLFMCAGAVIAASGRGRLTDLSGLARAMPVTAACFTIAGLSLIGMPGLNGYVSKGMILSATGEALPVVGTLLLLATAGTVLYVLKLLSAVFFRNDGETTPAGEAPLPMLVAMVGTALLCVAIGLAPGILLGLLPGEVVYHPFDPGHLIESLQLVLAAAVVFIAGRQIFSPAERTTLDVDRLYRRIGTGVVWVADVPLGHLTDAVGRGTGRVVDRVSEFSKNPVAAAKIVAWTAALPVVRTFAGRKAAKDLKNEVLMLRQEYPSDPEQHWDSGYGVFLVAILFFVYLVVYLLS
jgi:multicomponent Na+:H+ antiporter subunit D